MMIHPVRAGPGAGIRFGVIGLVALILVTNAAWATPGDRFADHFEAGFSGSSGTAPWNGDWIESEGDGADAGSVTVRTEPYCPDGPCLVMGLPAGGAGPLSVEREVDLGSDEAATLEFDYRRHQHGTGAGQIQLAISSDGGGAWSVLDTWELSASDPETASVTYLISDFTSPATRIRFTLSGDTDDSHFNVDNLEIEAFAGSPEVVVSELSTRNDFVEIYNAGTAPADIDGYSVEISGAGSTITVNQGGDPIVLGPGHHYLLARAAGGLAPLADQTFTSAVPHTTAITLRDAAGDLLDAVAVGTADAFEGQPLPGMPVGPDQSYERRAGGSLGSCIDTDDNRSDFVHNWGSIDPQGLTDEPVACGTPTAAGHVVISEFRPEGPGGPADEFVEILNPTPHPVDIGAWTFSVTAGVGFRDLHVVPDGTILDPSERYLLSGPDGPRPSDAHPYDVAFLFASDWGDVLLRDDTGAIVDVLGYGDPANGQAYETTPAAPYVWETADRSLVRRNGGSTDTDNNLLDFVVGFSASPDTSDDPPNQPPEFEQELPDRTDPENASISVSAAAFDIDAGDTVTYSATGLPSGLTIDAESGLISGTITYTAAGIYLTEVTATDDGSPPRSTSVTFTWTVNDTNRPPRLVDPGPQAASESELFTLVVTATDPDGTTPRLAGSGTLPAWAEMVDNGDGTATIAGTPGPGAAGTTTVVVTASDGDLADSVTFEIAVTPNSAPVWETVLSDRANLTGDAVAFSIRATDPDDDPIGYTATGLPPGLSIDAWSGQIAGVIAEDAAGAHTVTVVAADDREPPQSVSATFVWTIDLPNRPPVVVNPGDLVGIEGEWFDLTLIARDPDGDIPRLSTQTLPPWATMTDNGDGTARLTGTPALGELGSAAVTVVATDGLASHQATFTITVQPVPPALAPVPDLVVAEHVRLERVVALQHPSSTAVRFTFDGAPPGAAIDAESGRLTWTPGEAQGGRDHLLTVVIVADDGTELDGRVIRVSVIEVESAPVVDPIADIRAARGDDIRIVVTAGDADLPAAPPRYSLVDQPAAAAAIDPVSGVFHWEIAADEAIGRHTFTVRATDAHDPSLVSERTFTVWVGDRTVTDRRSEMLTALTADSDGDPPDEPAAPAPRRAFTLMASAGFASVKILGTPILLLAALFVLAASAGKVSLFPVLGRGRMGSGVVVWVDDGTGHGFIVADDAGREVFFDASATGRVGRPRPGQRVRFRLAKVDRRDFALNLTTEQPT